MREELTTFQIPKAGLDIKIYIDAMLSLKDRASDFSRSLGRVSWLQGHILLLAREKCEDRGDWTAFLASVGMKKGLAYLLRRVATDIVPEKKDLEFNEMLAIVLPNSYGKHLRDQADGETFGTQGVVETGKSGNDKVKTQTIEKAYARLGTIKNTIQQFADRKIVDSKLTPEQASQKYDLAIGAIDVCREELGKIAEAYKVRKKALTAPASKKRKAA